MNPDWQKRYCGQTVLVTGGAGMIGGHLVRMLAESGATKVVVLDDLSYGYHWRIHPGANVLFVQGSVTDDEKLKRVFAEGPRIVFHLAALFANQYSVEQPQRDLIVNGLGTLKVLEHAKLAQVERFVFAASSSSHARGLAAPELNARGTDPSLETPYQITKWLGESYCAFFGDYYGLSTVCPCLFNSYGPGEIPGAYRNVIANFIYLALQAKPLPITGSGQATRDFTFVEDHADGLLRAGVWELGINTTFDLGTGLETSVSDLAALINNMTGNTAGVHFTTPRKWDHERRRVAEVDRARKVIGYQSKMPLSQGLAVTIDWFRANWSRVLECAKF